MSKTLSTILTVFKVAKIVAKVIFILCIVGGAGCLVGLATLPLLDLAVAAEFIAEEGIELGAVYIACVTGAVTCAGEAVFAFFAERYFGHVLSSGTPFTFGGAKESFRLGITSIIISGMIAVATGLALAVAQLMSEGVPAVDVDVSVSLSTGLFFLFLSLIFRHGAELQRSVDKAAEEQKTPCDE